MTYTADVSMFPYFKKDDAKVVKKVVAPKPKSTREKKMSAGKSVLFTSGLMAKVGAYAIPKKLQIYRILTHLKLFVRYTKIKPTVK